MIGSPEPLTGTDLLGFAGIGPVNVLAIPRAQQFAEKIHAYSFSWGDRTNTRTKDFVDLLVLLERSRPDLAELRTAVRATFEKRQTHPVPTELAPPPDSWADDFALMASEAGLSTTVCIEAFRRVAAFWSAEKLGG